MILGSCADLNSFGHHRLNLMHVVISCFCNKYTTANYSAVKSFLVLLCSIIYVACNCTPSWMFRIFLTSYLMIHVLWSSGSWERNVCLQWLLNNQYLVVLDKFIDAMNELVLWSLAIRFWRSTGQCNGMGWRLVQLYWWRYVLLWFFPGHKVWFSFLVVRTKAF